MEDELSELLDRIEALQEEMEGALRAGDGERLEQLLERRVRAGEELMGSFRQLTLANLTEGLSAARREAANPLLQRLNEVNSRFMAFVEEVQAAARPSPKTGTEQHRPRRVSKRRRDAERQALARELAPGPLAGRDIVVLPIPRSKASAYAVATTRQTAYGDRRWLAQMTGHTAVVSASFVNAGDTWEESVVQADFLNRNGFQHEVGKGGKSVAAILERAARIDPVVELASLAQDRFEREGIDWEIEVDQVLEICGERFGVEPPRAELLRLGQETSPDLALERWLWQWEKEQGAKDPHMEPYSDWFDPRDLPVALLLLPVERPADVPAYLHWFGAGNLGSSSALVVALLRFWEERYGAVLVGHFGTMLHFEVERPPETMEEAWELARQQTTLAECTTALSGVTLREHAAKLVGLRSWFLHERP